MTTITARRPCLPGALIALTAHLAGCAHWQAQPQVLERLDTVSGTTVIALARPVTLVAAHNRGPGLDPFAFVAPFEIDRMGNRSLYLWVSTPEDKGGAQHMQVLCEGQPLELAGLDALPAGVSVRPYRLAAPWSGERYFSLTESALQCLASAARVSVAVTLAGDIEERFEAEPGSASTLAAFAAHHANPL